MGISMQHAELTIPGKVATVTGAGSGIGLQIADHLTGAGVDVAINDIDAEALTAGRETLGDNEGDLVTQQGDASDPDTATGLIERAVDSFGGLDILVNNVGIARLTKPIEEISYAEFIETLGVNLGATFATTKAAIPHLKSGEDGRIINISSMRGKRPLRDRTLYTTSKMGVIGFTRTLAVELANQDITVNAICPGSVDGHDSGRSSKDKRKVRDALSTRWNVSSARYRR